jgi:hypothetical protein
VGIDDKEIVKNVEARSRSSATRKLKASPLQRGADARARADGDQKAVEPFGYYRAIVEGKATRGGDPQKATENSKRATWSHGAPVHVRDVHIEVTGEGRNRSRFRPS